MKAENEVIGAVIIFFVGAGVGVVIDEKSFNLVYTVILPAVATLLAAFLGAKYAFSLQALKAEREVIESNVAAGNRAVFSFVRKYNKLNNIQTQFLEPYRGDPTAFIQMQPLLDLVKDDINIDIDSLSFLLETKHRNLPGEITIAVDKYRSAIDAINARSNLHLNQVQPLLEKAGFVEGGNYTHKQIEIALGKRIYATIVQTTDLVFEHTDKASIFIEDVSKKLTASLKEIFPEKQIIALSTSEQHEVRSNENPSKD